MPQLPDDWESTRTTLQSYGHALTAFPRAGGIPDDRWTHVAMAISDVCLVASAVPLSDGSTMVSTLDLANHRVVMEAGTDIETIDLKSGPSPQSIGNAVLAFVEQHGTSLEVDRDRFSGTETLVYDASHAEQFHAAAVFVTESFRTMNNSVDGEKTGPHLWPHGFDIATEWFSPKKVPYGDSEASAQIAIGWYPAAGGYFYANPWPFEESWGLKPVVEGSTWHLEDWQGAVVDADGIAQSELVSFGLAVHELAHETLVG